LQSLVPARNLRHLEFPELNSVFARRGVLRGVGQFPVQFLIFLRFFGLLFVPARAGFGFGHMSLRIVKRHLRFHFLLQLLLQLLLSGFLLSEVSLSAFAAHHGRRDAQLALAAQVGGPARTAAGTESHAFGQGRGGGHAAAFRQDLRALNAVGRLFR